jgi:plastocyanin
MRRAITGIVIVFALVALAAPVLAGGYAVVRLDEEPGEVAAEVPWRFGFMVRQHDITPTNDVTPVVRAQHTESGEEITATGEQEGPVGHFVAELTFPQAGEWKWSVMPEPFAETSFETLHVVAGLGAGAASHPARIHSGACTELGHIAFPLGEVALQDMNGESTQMPVALGVATIDVPLPELMGSDYAIGVGMSDPDSALAACGDIVDLSPAASAEQDELVVGLRGWNEARNVGVAVLRAAGEQTTVWLYLLDVGGEEAALQPPGKVLTVEIAGMKTEDWTFGPATLQAETGATVTWMNTSDAAHTVTGDDLAFDSSGLIEPGQTFSQTFGEAGTYHYRCGPHPWMEGTIVVT